MWVREREKEKMWVCEDVKMSRCEDEQMWRWEDVKIRRCEDVKMSRCEDEQMWRWANVKMRRCEDEQMWRWADVKMSKCEDEKMWRWEGVKMRRCEDEKVWRWEGVKMRRWDTDPHYWKNPALRRSREKQNLLKLQCYATHRFVFLKVDVRCRSWTVWSSENQRSVAITLSGEEWICRDLVGGFNWKNVVNLLLVMVNVNGYYMVNDG